MGKVLVVAVILVAAVAGYLVIPTKMAPPEPSPPTEIPVPMPTAIQRIQPEVSTYAREPVSAAARAMSNERITAIKHAMSKAMSEFRETILNGLVAQGLAPIDSEQTAQRFIEGFADCLFEAARREYETQGISVEEFLDRIEIVWTQPVESTTNLNRVQSAAAPCVANVGQQAGIPFPANFGTAANEISERFSAEIESPPWADEMEDRIRDHVASQPELVLTGLLVTCRENGCNVMMVGRDIRIFDLEFDVFAEQNGFKHAVLGGDSNRRLVWLPR